MTGVNESTKPGYYSVGCILLVHTIIRALRLLGMFQVRLTGSADFHVLLSPLPCLVSTQGQGN